MKTHVISLLVENCHGALSRIANLFSGRGYNISSLTVGVTDDPSMSRLTITVAGEENILEQIVKQLNKLIDVIKVIDFNDQPIIERELLFVRVDATKSSRREVLDLCAIFNARIVSVCQKSVIIELSGASTTIDDFLSMVRPFGIKEVVRSGVVAIAKAKN